MAKNWAIAIGINQYHFLQPLACAQADAEALRGLLVSNGGFRQQQSLLMSDSSPPIGDRPTFPTKDNILLLLEDLAAACWRSQDRVWFFFSGYGIHHNGKDYLMPVDGKPEFVEETGIEIATIMHTLHSVNVNALILLDINRAFTTQGLDTFVGQEIIELAQELQVPLILSCQPEQFSYESTELGHGFFTAALLEALSSDHGKTLGELEAYLSVRTPELCQYYWRPTQNPVTVITSSKQVILGNSELENDMDAAAIVVSEEIFAQAIASPSLEENVPSNYSQFHPPAHSQINSNSYPTNNSSNYSQLIKNSATTSFGKQSHVHSGIQEPIQRSLPPSLPPAKSKVEISQPISGIPKIHTASQETNTGLPFWMQVLLWGGSMTLLIGMTIILIFRHHADSKVEQTYSVPSNPNPDESSFVQTLPDAPANQTAPQTPATQTQAPSATPTTPAAKPTPTATVNPSPATLPSVNPAAINSPTDLPTDLPADAPTVGETTATATATPTPTPTTTSTPTVPVVLEPSETQSRKQALSELNKLSLSPNQASELVLAIAAARKIKPNEPRYGEAQVNIQMWNSMIFELANQRAKKRQYSSAIAAAQLISDSEALHPQAKIAINQWRQQAKQYLSNKTLIQAATGLIKPGQASTYNRAIEVAKKVSKGEPGFDIAQKSIDTWSKEIFKLAKNRAAKGERKAAIATATLVPEGTSAYDAAQKAIQRWKN
ncbi:caspase family protein [Calothrix sp. UHCC 0171]|uniref:caspase family protein n=1 Tax=Calothrix sp. UHCC 0171 TaxID=3110245 RepID=UPI002B2039E3|nr:caspase family protein [Calothrix sp. UHCC 0171]MEA5571650.1 caspase family protein [Calothrix sp. UHCC 0171]